MGWDSAKAVRKLVVSWEADGISYTTSFLRDEEEHQPLGT